MTPIDLLDLRAEYELFADEVRHAAVSVLDSQQFIGGPAVRELEEAFAGLIGTGHAIAVSSGTDALLCSLMALNIGPGDEVIVPAFTFIATAGVVARTHARPVFVDIDPKSFNLDPGSVERAITEKTRAIIAVHLFGQCAAMDEINAIATRHEIPVIEDAAQAIRATYRGRSAGALGKIGCFSFYPTKNLGGFGEGGMIVTDDEELASIMRSLRNHGETRRYVCERVGANFRLDTMKAAILLVKMNYLDRFTDRRRHNAGLYDRLLAGAPVATPHVIEENEHVYHQYSILCERRDELKTFLGDCGIGSAIYYPLPLHLQNCFESLGYGAGDMPVAEATCGKVLSLPCHPMLSEDNVRTVCSKIREFYGASESGRV